MLHRTARLTPFGRQLLVERVLIEGWPAATAAEMLGVSRATAYKWLRRFREEGVAGLEDRSARPHRRPRALPEREVRRILVARRRLRVGPHRLGPLLGHSRSTVYGVLRRHGVSRLAHADRLTGVPVRYVRERTTRPHPRSLDAPGMDEQPKASRYEIQVGGILSERMLGAFPDLRARTTGRVTVLVGDLPDQAALHGVLSRIESLGLELVEVRRATPRVTDPGMFDTGPDVQCARYDAGRPVPS